jgi:predicted transcriptional regulator
MCEKEKPMKNFYDKTVQDIMQTKKSEIIRIDETTPVPRILSSLKTKDHVWVMDSSEPTQLLGIITRSDMLSFFSPPLTSSQSFDQADSRSGQFGEMVTAEELMSKKPVTASPDETIRDILVKMKEQKIKHLPIIDEYNQLMGEVTLPDIIHEYARYLPQINKREIIQ